MGRRVRVAGVLVDDGLEPFVVLGRGDFPEGGFETDPAVVWFLGFRG